MSLEKKTRLTKSSLEKNPRIVKLKKELTKKAMEHELYKNVIESNGNIVFGRGSAHPKILFIGEAPGFTENKLGEPFVGRSGKLLEEWVKELGLSENDYAIINVVPIIPLTKEKKIRPPTLDEINYFLPLTKKIISEFDSRVIVLLGKSAARALNLEGMRVSEVRELFEKKVFFVYHPAYYLRRGQKGFSDLTNLRELIK